MRSIVNAVLSSLQTNSRTIEQLTAVTSLSDSDCFEINGGKKVTYGVLRGLIESLSTSEQDSLKVLIGKSELKSVNITTTENSATLIIESVGKRITTVIPVATNTSIGLMTAADKVKLQSGYETAFEAQSTATTAQNIAYNAYTTANNANDNAVKALYLADTGSKELKALKEHIGTPRGIAPLDEWGKISNGYFQAAMVAVTAMEPTWSLPKGEPGNIAVAYVPHEGGAVSPRFMRCNNAGEWVVDPELNDSYGEVPADVLVTYKGGIYYRQPSEGGELIKIGGAIEVADEDEMQQLIESGKAIDGQLYFIAEE